MWGDYKGHARSENFWKSSRMFCTVPVIVNCADIVNTIQCRKRSPCSDQEPWFYQPAIEQSLTGSFLKEPWATRRTLATQRTASMILENQGLTEQTPILPRSSLHAVRYCASYEVNTLEHFALLNPPLVVTVITSDSMRRPFVATKLKSKL